MIQRRDIFCLSFVAAKLTKAYNRDSKPIWRRPHDLCPNCPPHNNCLSSHFCAHNLLRRFANNCAVFFLSSSFILQSLISDCAWPFLAALGLILQYIVSEKSSTILSINGGKSILIRACLSRRVLSRDGEPLLLKLSGYERHKHQANPYNPVKHGND